MVAALEEMSSGSGCGVWRGSIDLDGNIIAYKVLGRRRDGSSRHVNAARPILCITVASAALSQAGW